VTTQVSQLCVKDTSQESEDAAMLEEANKMALFVKGRME
jgi:hypothetical protein